MSEEVKLEIAAAGCESEDIAGAVPARKGKRRNCMVIPGTSDPLIAKMFSQALMKEVLGKSEEAAPENPEDKEEKSD